jgi:hypothetical protein
MCKAHNYLVQLEVAAKVGRWKKRRLKGFEIWMATKLAALECSPLADYLGLIADAVEMLRADFPASDTTDAVYSLSLGGGVFQRLARYMEAL